MALLDTVNYTKATLLDTFWTQGENVQKIYLSKSYFKSLEKDQYFIKSYLLTPKGDLICQGYIYFYLNEAEKKSEFIGSYVKEEFRGMGIASLLFSSWMKLCLEEGYENLTTNPKQRKPFLLYLLKTFSFEIQNPLLYEQTESIIKICRILNDPTKYLYFKNAKQKELFLKSDIMKKDNYQVLEYIKENIQVLDQVILSKIYSVQDSNFAYQKSLKIQKRYQ